MAIDRIGGKGAPPVGQPSAPVAPTEGAAPPPRIEGERLAPTTAAQSTSGTSPLDRLRAGEIDVSTYVDLKVDEATGHLTKLRPDDLETIRSELRHRMLSDPSLVDLVQSATGTAVPEE